MLEKATPDKIRELQARPGTVVAGIDLQAATVGMVFRAETSSGNVYLFEVTDPKNQRAHVVRCESRPRAPETGYRGERTIQPSYFKAGNPVWHGNSNTSPIMQFVILD